MPALGGGSLIALTALGPVLLKTSLPVGGAAAAGTLTASAPVSLAAGAAGTAVAGGGKVAGAALLSKGAVTALKGSGSFLSKATGAAVSAPPSSLAATTGEAAHIASHSAHFAHVAAKTTGSGGLAGAAGAGAIPAHPVGSSLHPHAAPVSHHPAGTMAHGTSSAHHAHADASRYRTGTTGNREVGPGGQGQTRPPHAHGQVRNNGGHLHGNSRHVLRHRPTQTSTDGNGKHGNGAPTPTGSLGTGESMAVDPTAGAEVAPSAGSREVSMITTIAGLALLRWAVGQVCCAGRRKQSDEAGGVGLKQGNRKGIAKRIARWSREEEVVVVLKDEDHVAGPGISDDRSKQLALVSVAETTGHRPAMNVHVGDKVNKALCNYKALRNEDAGNDSEEGKESVDGIISHLESETTASAGGEDDTEKDRQSSGHEDGMLGPQEIPRTHERSATAQRFTYVRRRRSGRTANFL
ncbi:conserved hypothetical protein [Neospora caninum Liverpool]|uniref:Uncharacterized protein n=1 Tax=Neospora caninum (strain Liverpool) TaxID=572307 RepID=F0VL66_NEOCL|nr:conserved hypothetical protein [Neospora caninum Liverpool]CBZ54818.1 conserved hypothetical protein [Neospora caninum Liverpool]CEL69537.1 TPA: hypothetical protein BN1204_052440 [Neospora caninum Liverpool]|eukprot:XP_003884846.1 conserved hypothetical protein [Neospora caninum Liverpool]